MKVLVCGSTGCIGAAVVHALRARGHKVVEGSRRPGAAREHWPLDFARPVAPQRWAERLRDAQVDTVVNCVGILMPSRGQRFERIHAQGPIELFRGAALAGVRRVIQVSALGVGPGGIDSEYLHSKLLADDLLATLPVEWAVLRPSLVYGPRSASAALFAMLAALPVVSLPGRGAQRLQPLHVYELAEAIARLVEQRGALRAVHELGGPEAVSYCEMLAGYRAALGLGEPLWLPVPMPLMKLAARMAGMLPQKSFSPETLRLLERGSVPSANALPTLLGRSPTALAQGLRISPPEPSIDLRGSISRAASLLQKLTIGVLAVLLWISHTR
jgi:uncharacterized protein YbjT (DUF2867 family)